MNNRLWRLLHGDLVEIPDARGTTLHVARGRLWLTQERDRRDIVLDAGDTYTVERDGVTVAEAQGDTTVAVFKSATGRSERSRAGWQRRIDDWFERSAARHLRTGHHL